MRHRWLSALAKLTGKPLWLQAHGIEAWQAPSRAVRFAVERAKLITAVSRYTRKRLLVWADVDPAMVRVLPNTILPSWAKRRRSHALQDRYGLAGKRVILTVGRLSTTEAYKGHDRIIGVLPELIRRYDAAYLIVGDGDDTPRLKTLAAGDGRRRPCSFRRSRSFGGARRILSACRRIRDAEHRRGLWHCLH